jgi:hypothetical protein
LFAVVAIVGQHEPFVFNSASACAGTDLVIDFEGTPEQAVALPLQKVLQLVGLALLVAVTKVGSAP